MTDRKLTKSCTMRRRTRTLPTIILWVSSVLATWIATSPAEAACRVPRFRFCANCDVTITITTQRNTPCRINYWSTGGIDSQKVTVRPRGVYGTANVTRGAYKPPLNFVGDDYFEVLISYEVKGTKTWTKLKVTVKITE